MTACAFCHMYTYPSREVRVDEHVFCDEFCRDQWAEREAARS